MMLKKVFVAGCGLFFLNVSFASDITTQVFSARASQLKIGNTQGNYADFSGSWVGSCHVKGESIADSESTLDIENNDKALLVNGVYLGIGAKNSMGVSDASNSGSTQNIIAWNDTKTALLFDISGNVAHFSKGGAKVKSQQFLYKATFKMNGDSELIFEGKGLSSKKEGFSKGTFICRYTRR